jgi:hypothetical protein
LRNWLKTILFVSAFSPTLLVLAGVRYYSGVVDTLFYQLIVISLIGITLPFLILSWVKSQTEALNFTAKKVESADYYLLVFLASYASPIIMKIAEIDFSLMLLTVGVIFVVAWVISNIPSHPVLYLAKFRFYKIESESGMVYTLITRREIRNPKNITQVKQISNSMLME